jgi:hypothetical protein
MVSLVGGLSRNFKPTCRLRFVYTGSRFLFLAKLHYQPKLGLDGMG